MTNLIPKPSGIIIPNKDKEKILSMISEGKTLTEVRKSLNLSAQAFYDRLHADPDFHQKIETLRVNILDEMSEMLLTMPDTYADVHRATLKSNNLKWLLSRRLPKKYGDSMVVDVRFVSLNDAISEARARSAIETVSIKRDDSDNTLSYNPDKDDDDVMS